jgi:hypothetical protein
MNKSAFTKVHRFKNVPRLCMLLVMSCVLVLGGVSLLAPIPALATCGINLIPDATEGQHYSTLMLSTSTGGGYTCKVMAFDYVYTPPLPFPFSFDTVTAKFSCDPPIGSAGQYTICFQCQEYDQNGTCYPTLGGCDGLCWPAGNTQCQKCVTLTVLPATTGSCTLSLAVTDMPQGQENHSYIGSLYATGGTTMYTFTASGLPAGLQMAPHTGFIVGTPPQGSAGTYPVQVTVTEAGGGCTPASISFLINIAGAPPIPPTPPATTFNYTVGIGSGPTSNAVSVTVNGSDAASLLSGETKTMQGTKGNNYNVNVPSTIQGNSSTRYVIKGSPAKTVNYDNPSAIFDYAAEYYVEFKTDPKNVAQLQGSNWYAGGTQISSAAPESVKSEGENLEYVFTKWDLPDGGTSLSKDLAVTVNGPGSYVARYSSNPIAGKTQSSNLMWIIILVAVVVAAGIAIGILASRREKQSAKTRPRSR